MHIARALVTIAASCTAAASLGGGISAADATTTATPAAASSVDGVKCATPTRVFQLRGSGTEIWVATISRSDSSDPTTYAWRKVYDVPTGRGLSLAAHSESAESATIQLLLSDEHGSLRSLGYNKDEAKVTSSRTLAPGSAASPGSYRFTSLTSDGNRLWGAVGGQLKVMTGISTTKAPRARATVEGLNGFWPQAFFGNSSGTYEIGWTDSDGRLTYGDVTNSGGWKLNRTKIATEGPYSSKAIATPGGEVLLRSDATSLLRYRGSEEGVSGRQTIDASWAVSNGQPMTTVPDMCSRTDSVGGAYSLPLDRETEPRSEYDDPHHTYPTIDLQVPTGTTVRAVRGGVATAIDDPGGCGTGILINGDDGAAYTYCHLSSRRIGDGSALETGQAIGLSGNTGSSTGPHLHLQIKTSGTLRCPQPMLLDIYDGKTPPSPTNLPTGGCVG